MQQCCCSQIEFQEKLGCSAAVVKQVVAKQKKLGCSAAVVKQNFKNTSIFFVRESQKRVSMNAVANKNEQANVVANECSRNLADKKLLAIKNNVVAK